MIEQLIILVVSFFIYSLMGWLWESVILPLSRRELPYNSGFLNGPWIPIYGFGAILVIILFDIRATNYPPYALFICGGVVACLLEYFTSYVMELLFHHRWWDYSHKAFNLNGRICLEGFICFGLFSVLAIDYVQPFFTLELLKIKDQTLFYLSIVLCVLFIMDFIISVRSALDIEKNLELVRELLEQRQEQIIARLEQKQALALKKIEEKGLELKKQHLLIKSLLKNKKLFKYNHRRLIRAFPHLTKKKKGE